MSGATHRTVAIALAAMATSQQVIRTDVLVGGAFVNLLASVTLSAIVACAGAILPDLDLRSLPRHPWLAKVFPHRGVSHSLVGIALGGGLALLALSAIGLPSLGAPFILGWLSHTLADALICPGVALLWPRSRHVYLLPASRRLTPSGERAFRVLVVLAAVTSVGITFVP